MTSSLRIFIIAGEASGDLLGAGLMRALKATHPDVSFIGVGGEQMKEQGLNSLFPMQELSVMGVAEVLPKIFGILRRVRQCVKSILDAKPDAVITIDSPDFNFRVAKAVKAKKTNIPVIHYVAPSVWAWRPGRAKMVSKFLDHILTLLPFEPKYFEAHGLGATFVGHPVVERLDHRGDGAKFRQKHGLAPETPVLCLLPGSRMSEITRLLSTFSQTADIVIRSRHQTTVVIPTLPHLKGYIDRFFAGKGINPIVTITEEEKYNALAAGAVALAASGTVTLELALTDTPHVVAYKLNSVSAMAARHLIKTPYVNLINIILGKKVVPELLLENCEPGPLSKALLPLLDNKEARTHQLTHFREALIQLGLGDPQTPSQKAAEAVLKVISAPRTYSAAK